MLELISIICSLAICILTPIEVHKIRAGRVRKGFAGDRAKYIAAFDKQLSWLMWVGLVFGVLTLGLAFIEKRPGEAVVKIVAAIIWFAVACITYIAHRQLAGMADRTTAPS